MIIDSKTLKENADTLLKSNSRAKEVLQKANGERHYKEIADMIGINEKTVSPILSLAKELGFAERIKAGVYKKKTSNMKYIPNKKKAKKATDKKDRTKQVKAKVSKAVKKSKEIELSSGISNPSSTENMTEAYAWLYIAENNLRNLIRKVLGKTSIWWGDKAPVGVKNKVKDAMDNYPYDGSSRDDELEYTHLGQLKEIIIKRSNWESFKSLLEVNDKENFRVIVDKAIPTRNSIGHCIPLRGNDLKEVSVRFNDILKMIK